MGATPARAAICPPPQSAKLRQTRHKRRRNHRADAFDRGEKFATPPQAGVPRQKRRDGGLKAGNQAGLSFELSLQQTLQNGACSGGGLVLQSRLTGFGGLPRQNQFLKLGQAFGGDRRHLGAYGCAIERKQARVDLVRLGKLAKRIGELSRTIGIDNSDRETRRAQLAVSKPMQLSRRLHDDKPGGGRGQRQSQTLAPFLAVGNAKTLASWMQINVEPRFTHIDPGIHCESGSYGCHLALHAGLAPQSSVQIASRGADGPSSPASQKLKGRTVPPARLMRDGHPS
jgi:hypothetical protein